MAASPGAQRCGAADESHHGMIRSTAVSPLPGEPARARSEGAVVRRDHPTWAVLCLLAAGLSACTSADAGRSSAPTTAGSTATAVEPVQKEPGAVPLVHGGFYDSAVADFGPDQVAAAAATAAEIARIALADCVRWTTGEVDPRLTALVAPDLITRSLAELDRSAEYGGTPVPSLLSHLPEDDGNGHDLVADLAQGGCGASGPMHYPNGAVRVSAGGGDRPGLVLSGGFAMNVRLGSTSVSAGQDWDFTLEPDAGGWRLTDVAPVMANVNWALKMAD